MNLSPPIEVVVTEPPASVLQAFCSSSCGFATSRDTGPAMSQENVDIVAGTIAAFNRGDLDAGSDYWSDDLDYRAAQGAPDDPRPIHGKEAMRAYVEDWLDTFEDFRGEVIELIDAGDDVIVVMRIGGRAKLSGVETDLTFAAIYTIRDGKIARGREYWTREEALEAAGLRE